MDAQRLRQIYLDIWTAAVQSVSIEDWVYRPAPSVKISFERSIGADRFEGTESLVLSRRYLLPDNSEKQENELRNTLAVLLARMAIGQTTRSENDFYASSDLLLVARAFGYDDEANEAATKIAPAAITSKVH